MSLGARYVWTVSLDVVRAGARFGAELSVRLVLAAVHRQLSVRGGHTVRRVIGGRWPLAIGRCRTGRTYRPQCALAGRHLDAEIDRGVAGWMDRAGSAAARLLIVIDGPRVELVELRQTHTK